jgi:hypothetical protein
MSGRGSGLRAVLLMGGRGVFVTLGDGGAGPGKLMTIVLPARGRICKIAWVRANTRECMREGEYTQLRAGGRTRNAYATANMQDVLRLHAGEQETSS